MYLHYQTQNGVLYASLATSTRKGNKVLKSYANLGRVLDKKRGIYKSNSKGIFAFDLNTGSYSAPPKDFVVPELIKPKRNPLPKLLLDFGSSYLLYQLLKRYRIIDIIEQLPLVNTESFKALLMYYILCRQANCYAQDWLEGDFASLLFPKANLGGVQISRLLEECGEEAVKQQFFESYLNSFPCLRDKCANVAIDSTGLPNSIHFPLTAISNHNGRVSEEVRLTYVAQIGTRLPLYFQYDPGNILDKNLFTNIIEHLQALGINTSEIIVDAGYSSLENLSDCFRYGLNFITRLSPNLTLYKEAVRELADSLESHENAVTYSQRLLYVRRVEKFIGDKKLYVYLGLDDHERHAQLTSCLRSKKLNQTSAQELSRKRSELGRFVLVSSSCLPVADIVPYYYKRQDIEQLFDVCKNYTKTLPLRVHDEQTFKGHMLLTFIAVIVSSLIQMDLDNVSWHSTEQKESQRGRKGKFKEPTFNRVGLFLKLKNQKCSVYKNKIVPTVPYKSANEVYQFFKIESPNSLPLRLLGNNKFVDIKDL